MKINESLLSSIFSLKEVFDEELGDYRYTIDIAAKLKIVFSMIWVDEKASFSLIASNQISPFGFVGFKELSLNEIKIIDNVLFFFDKDEKLLCSLQVKPSPSLKMKL